MAETELQPKADPPPAETTRAQDGIRICEAASRLESFAFPERRFTSWANLICETNYQKMMAEASQAKRTRRLLPPVSIACYSCGDPGAASSIGRAADS